MRPLSRLSLLVLLCLLPTSSRSEETVVEKAKEAAKELGRAAKKTGKKLKPHARKAGTSVKEAGKEVKKVFTD